MDEESSALAVSTAPAVALAAPAMALAPAANGHRQASAANSSRPWPMRWHPSAEERRRTILVCPYLATSTGSAGLGPLRPQPRLDLSSRFWDYARPHRYVFSHAAKFAAMRPKIHDAFFASGPALGPAPGGSKAGLEAWRREAHCTRRHHHDAVVACAFRGRARQGCARDRGDHIHRRRRIEAPYSSVKLLTRVARKKGRAILPLLAGVRSAWDRFSGIN